MEVYIGEVSGEKVLVMIIGNALNTKPKDLKDALIV